MSSTTAISQHKGRTGRVFFDGTELCVTNWEATHSAEEEDTTNSCSAGFSEFAYGTEMVEGSVSADWLVTVNIFDDPPNIRAGTFAILKLYIHSYPGVGNESGPFYTFSAGINNVKLSVPAKGKVSYSFDFKSDGIVTFPVGGESDS